VNIPPLESEAQALALPEVTEVYDRARGSSLQGAMCAGNLRLLLAAIGEGGAAIGTWDVEVLEMVAALKPEAVAAVAGWIVRAGEVGAKARKDGRREDGSDE
jgi:hypothetical protein